MSNIVAGHDMVLEVKISGVYTPIGCATACSFEFSNEIILKTDVNAGLFRKKRVRISDCRASVQGLTTLVNDTTISALYFLQEGVRRSEQDLRFRFTDEGGLQKQVQGLFIVSSVKLTGDVSGFAEHAIDYEGTGGFSISTIDDGSSGTSTGDVLWDWWEVADGAVTITGAGHYGRSFAGRPTIDIIEVDREGSQYNYVASSPTGLQFTYDGTTIAFDPANPMVAGARVFVIWQI